MKNIEIFCEQNGFEFVAEGEAGFGRECVGINQPGKDEWVAAAIYDEEYNVIAENTVKTAENAYHKFHCLAVLGRGENAIKQLDEWIGRIIAAGYKIQEYRESSNSVGALLNGRRTLKAVVDL